MNADQQMSAAAAPATNDGAELIEEFAAALRPLPQELANAFLDCLCALVRNAVVEFSDSGRVTAPGTRCGTLSLRVVGVEELIAAARAAS